jgi:hypothetical protein
MMSATVENISSPAYCSSAYASKIASSRSGGTSVSLSSGDPESDTKIAENQKEIWQMTFREWGALRDHFRKQFNATGNPLFFERLGRIGGRTTDAAHRYHVQNAIKNGKPVPMEVRADYPEL